MNGRGDFLTLREAMDRLMQDTFVRPSTGNGQTTSGRYFIPNANAWESEDELVVELALPGVDPNNVDVTFEHDTLTISGHFPELDQEKNWILRERPHGPFQRRFTLQVPIDVDKLDAQYRNGILTLHLPKSEAIKPRKIQIKAE